MTHLTQLCAHWLCVDTRSCLKILPQLPSLPSFPFPVFGPVDTSDIDDLWAECTETIEESVPDTARSPAPTTDGAQCVHCLDWYPMAQPNAIVDERECLVCYRCRTGSYAWKYRDALQRYQKQELRRVQDAWDKVLGNG